MSADEEQPPKPPVRRKMVFGRAEGHPVLLAWLEAHRGEPEACNGMRVWAYAVANGAADQLASGEFTNEAGQSFSYALVPGTSSMVIFYYRRTVPVSTIVFVDVIDWPF